MTLKHFLRQLAHTRTPRAWLTVLGRWFYGFSWLRVGQGLRAEHDSSGLTLEVDLPSVAQHLAYNSPATGMVRLMPGDSLGWLVNKVAGSLEVNDSFNTLALIGDDPGELIGALKYYGTGTSGIRGWHALPLGDSFQLRASADDPTPGFLADKVDDETLEVSPMHRLRVKAGGLGPSHLQLNTTPLTVLTGLSWDAASGQLRLTQRSLALGDAGGQLALILGAESEIVVLTAVECE